MPSGGDYLSRRPDGRISRVKARNEGDGGGGEGGRGCSEATLTKKGPSVGLCRERCLHDGVCLTTVRRAEGVAKREELAVKRPGEPLFWLLREEHPLAPYYLEENTGDGDYVHNMRIIICRCVKKLKKLQKSANLSNRNFRAPKIYDS